MFLNRASDISTLVESPSFKDRISVTALIKGEGSYSWFKYTGPTMTMTSKQGIKQEMSKGTIFGVRPSSSGKQIRLVFQELGLTKVFTIEPDLALKLSKNCKKA